MPGHRVSVAGHAIHGKFTGTFKLRRVPITWRILMAEQRRVEIELTETQKAQIKAATGKDAESIELSVEELEERIAPSRKGVGPRIGPQL